MYRAVTWYFLENNIDYANELAVYDALNHISIKFVREGDQNVLYCNGQPLKAELRSMEVSNKVSEISAIPEVRVKMVTLQQQMGSNGAVMDSRDIGTVVFPEADFKFFSLLILLYAPNAVLMNSKKKKMKTSASMK